MWPFKKKQKLIPVVNLINSGLSEIQILILQKGKCPDCDGSLYEGPCGGMMMNVRCDNGHKFNITNPEIQGMAPFIAQRI